MSFRPAQRGPELAASYPSAVIYQLTKTKVEPGHFSSLFLIFRAGQSGAGLPGIYTDPHGELLQSSTLQYLSGECTSIPGWHGRFFGSKHKKIKFKERSRCLFKKTFKMCLLYLKNLTL